jgi:SAM-dependent methyltransferase
VIDRDGVRDAARYLRNVRPIDPEAVVEYVAGDPHPAVVARTLREEAVALGLVEREDGAFVPVSADPPRPDHEAVTAFPERYGRRLEDLLVDTYGPDWHRGESGDGLRERLREVKAAYLEGDPVEYDRETALAYAVYHLPDYYAAVRYPLAELARAGLLDRRLRVVDVGAGVGGPALGLFDFLPDDALVDYHAVEPSAAADVLAALLEETGRNVHATVHRETAEAVDFGALGSGGDAAESDADGPDAGVDLFLFGNVLSELADPAAVLRRALDALAPDGTVLALAPADRETSVGLRRIERAVAGYVPAGAADVAGGDGEVSGDAITPADTAVYAPTVRLWPDRHPTDDPWSFDVRPDIAVPPVQDRLDGPAGSEGEFVNVDVQFSHSLLRVDGRRKFDVAPSAERYAPLADSDDHVTDRVNALVVKLSRDLADGGNPVFCVGDGSQSTNHFAVLTRETALNRTLLDAEYGALLSVEETLVLWNDDEAAYNLVVDDETVVDLVGE